MPSPLKQKLKKIVMAQGALDDAASQGEPEEKPPVAKVPVPPPPPVNVASEAENLVALKKKQAALKGAMSKPRY